MAGLRHERRREAVTAGDEQHRQDPGHRTQAAVEGQLADEQHARELGQQERRVGRHERERRREVERRASLAQAGGREVDRDAAVPLERQAAVAQRRPDPRLALAHGRVREPDHR